MATSRPAGLNTSNSALSGRAWAVRLPLSAAAQLAMLRTTPGIELAIVGESFWLQGSSLSKELEQRFLCLAGAERFYVLGDRQLVPVQCLIPTAMLPAGPWIKIRDWLTMVKPTPGFTGIVQDRVPLQLVRGSLEFPNTGLLTTLKCFAEYAETASALRLAGCRFVADEQGRVFIMGDPLPSLPGTYYYERERLWIPAGWTWSPALEPALVQQVLKLAKSEHLLWESSLLTQRFDEADFVTATRAAVRTTARLGAAP